MDVRVSKDIRLSVLSSRSSDLRRMTFSLMRENNAKFFSRSVHSRQSRRHDWNFSHFISFVLGEFVGRLLLHLNVCSVVCQDG